jgi:DNA replication protein DnaC
MPPATSLLSRPLQPRRPSTYEYRHCQKSDSRDETTRHARIHRQALNDATRDKSSYSELLDTLLQAEADYRQERKTGYRIKAAKFTLRPAFEDIDFTASRSISKTQIKELYGLQWLHDARPVLLIGQTGVGKTFIAQAAGLHACACGKSVLYMTLTTWLENLALARTSGTYLRYRDKLAKPDLVILDDMGMRKLSATEAQDLCELLEERSINKSTLFTTQLLCGPTHNNCNATHIVMH